MGLGGGAFRALLVRFRPGKEHRRLRSRRRHRGQGIPVHGDSRHTWLGCTRVFRPPILLTKTDGMQEPTWARRLLILLSLGLVVALPALWISSQYLQNEMGGVLSYNVKDGWCEFGVYPGLGVHCFGDYTSQVLTAERDFGIDPHEGAPGASPGRAYTSLYPPISQFPHVVAATVREGTGSNEFAFYLYIAVLTLAALVPALLVAWRWRESPFLVVPVLLIGVAAVPVIAVVDRGNSAGLVIPLLLAFALFLGKDRPWLAPGLVVGAALVRPQFILIALALVAIGRWRHAVAAAAAFIGITFASFALTAGGWSASARSWWDNVTGFQGGAGNIGLPTPANISIPRSVVSVGAWVGEAPGPIGSAGRWLAQSVYDRPLFAVGGVVLVATAVFLVAAGRVPRSVAITIPLVIAGTASTVSPVYYLSFALVLAALILGTHIAGGDEDGMLDGADGATTPTPWFWGWPLVIIIMLSLAPLPFALDTDPALPLLRNAYILENIGKAWLALVLIGLAWVAYREFRVRWSASKGPVAPS